MKNQPIILILFFLLTIVSCKQPTEAPVEVVEENTETADAPDYAAFDAKVAVIRAFTKAHEDENLALQTELLSDTLKYSPPTYNGNKWLGKTEYLAALKGYHKDFDNIKFTEGIALDDTTETAYWSGSVYPEASASNSPNAIRTYGTWTAKHTASGKEVGLKFYGLTWINKDGKIVRSTSYFDASSLAAQIAKK
jgi:hypothetical protein